MNWRTVIISSRCKLDLKMGYLVVRGEEVRRIFLDEIAILLIENPAVALTGCLLSALAEKKIKLLLNTSAEKTAAEVIRKNKPSKGVVQMLTITEKQFSKMEWVVGSFHSEVIDSDERMIEL